MTVRVDLSQAPARVVVTGSIPDVRDGVVPRFWLEFGGDGPVDVVIEPDAALEVATRLRAAVMLLLIEADSMSAQAHRRSPASDQRSAGGVDSAHALLQPV